MIASRFVQKTACRSIVNRITSRFCLFRTTHVLAIFTGLLIWKSCWADSTQQPTIAIIIDDMGNQLTTGSQLINLPYPLTFSFLPNRRHSSELINKAKFYKKEIMLHSPMENQVGFKLGKGGLSMSMSEMQIKQTLRQSFIATPHMAGLNNHMGSKLTEQPKFMKWVMETVRQHPFFFLDSRTSANSVAAKVARRYGIPSIERDVFLDHHQTWSFIQQQFNKLIDIARKKGTAIAIGHPHQVTFEYLSRALEKLDEKGISIATASAIWQIQNPTLTMQKIFAARKPIDHHNIASASTAQPANSARDESSDNLTLAEKPSTPDTFIRQHSL